MQAEVSVKNMDINTFHDLRVWANRAILITTLATRSLLVIPPGRRVGDFSGIPDTYASLPVLRMK